jgi:cystathionine beta-lyase/cystathionine gamma-synthase
MRMFQQVLARFGLTFTFVDTRDPEAVRAAIRDETRLIHLETPTNPMMRVADIRAIAAIAREAGVPLCVDNTFATPINQRPLELGAQLVVHSATKYLNGHSDVIGGVVATVDEGWAEHLAFMQKATGGILGPWDSWLVLRGTKTLHLRMAAHNRNGMEVARFLAGRDDLLGVFYPGLPDDPSHRVAASQMCGFTGMVSFEVEDLERAGRIATSMRVFTLAESLGGVESLVNHPAVMTHASVPEEARKRMGVTDGLLRLSVGIEAIDDLLADLERALDA